MTASPLTTVLGATGEASRFVGWVSDAWSDIQQKREDWKFRFADFGFNTNGGVREYSPAIAVPNGTFGDWIPETVRVQNSPIQVVFSTTPFGVQASVGVTLQGATSGAAGTILALGATATQASTGQYVILTNLTGYFTPGESLMVGVNPVGTFTSTPLMTGASSTQTNLSMADFSYYSGLAGGALISTEQYMSEWEWPIYRDVYLFGSNASVQGYGRPLQFAVRPENSNINLALSPDSDYYVHGRYRRSIQVLAADTDVPTQLTANGGGALPMFGQYHMLIVYAAMKKYAAYESASDVMARAAMEWNPMYSNMVNRWTDPVTLSDALA